MGTVAGIVDARGTVFVEAVRDAALRLTFHKITLKTERREFIFVNLGLRCRKEKVLADLQGRECSWGGPSPRLGEEEKASGWL